MSDSAPRWWRLIGTALSFTAFGLGALVLAVPITLNRLLPGPAPARARRGQYLVHRAFRLHLWLMETLGVMRCRVDGAERLNGKGQLVIANHPSLIDVVCLIAQLRHANCIVKAQLWRNPFTRGPVSGAGYISNRDSARMVDEAVAWLRDGGTMVIFPEGTRTRPNRPPRFQRGAANIALRADCRLTPVRVRCTPTTLTKAEPWYRIPPRRFLIHLQVGEDIELGPFLDDGVTPMAVRRLTHYLEQRFTQETDAHERQPGTGSQAADHQHPGS